MGRANVVERIVAGPAHAKFNSGETIFRNYLNLVEPGSAKNHQITRFFGRLKKCVPFCPQSAQQVTAVFRLRCVIGRRRPSLDQYKTREWSGVRKAEQKFYPRMSRPHADLDFRFAQAHAYSQSSTRRRLRISSAILVRDNTRSSANGALC
jgi:hypothetical protein